MSKILVFCPIGLGNFIMATPALEGIFHRQNAGDLYILALKSGIREMAEASGWFKKVYYWDPDREPLMKGIKLALELRREGFDISLSLFPTGHWKFALFSWLTGAQKRCGFIYPHSRLAGMAQTANLTYDPESHDVDQNKNLVREALDEKIDFPDKLSFPVKLAFPSPAEQTFVCHAGSSQERGMQQKRVPLETLVPLIEKICSGFSLKCIIVGGPEEKPLKDKMKAILGEQALNRDTANLSELGDVIASSRFFMGNDSGIMHMAEALEKSCIVFFGPSNEKRTGPYSPAAGESKSKFPRHLILRNPDDDTSRLSAENPKLSFSGIHGLQNLDPDYCWKIIEPFLKDVLKS